MKNKSILTRRFFSLILLISPLAYATDLSNRLTVDRYLSWEDINDAQLSPDSRQIIYSRRWVDPVNDSWDNSLWIINSDGTRNRFLVDGFSARWSPDGTRIAFLAEGKTGGTQIFVRWMDAEGSISQVSRLNKSPSNILWSPDGKTIGFQMVVPPDKNGDWNISMPARPDDANWTDESTIIDRLNYRRDRIGYHPEGFRHIFTIPADGGTPHQVTHGDWNHDSFKWMPDGKSIVFQSLRVEDAEYEWRESEIYSIDVSSGEIRQLTSRKGPDSGPIPSPDGRYIAYTGFDWSRDTYIEEGIYFMRSDGSKPVRIASEMGRRPANLTWAEDGSGLYFNAALKGSSNLYFAPLSGKPKAITNGKQMLRVSDISKRGFAVGTHSTSHLPRNLVSFSIKKPSQITKLYSTNKTHLSEVKLGEVEEIWYNSVDNLRIQGWVVKPPDFDPSKKYPLILRIHGGPHAMYNCGFDFKNQNHAANGYVVLYTNPRGSSGYGSSFGNAIKNAYPDKDYYDLMAGVDEVISRGYIDERNLFVYGGSGGGVLTAWIVGQTDRFTAAVSKAPVTNWISFVGTTDGSSWYYNFEELPWEDPAEHLRRSPLMYVGNVTTPTMLMTGEKDLRTPMEQTEQYYRALKLRKVPTAMIRLTDGWHSRSNPPTNFIRVQLYLRNWFERFSIK
ncbi:MAG: peptidase S9 [Candidatus Marinimicrobia bacterium]|nr:peptidase S9 [Candidatus Neomarinimicrobiota bacterium]|tara:strand:- start:872 stop:2887 length:2016 start_codon:yes stop_codon:yes gene_type:complete